MSGLLEVAELGLPRADRCDAYPGGHRPTPYRYIWHHIQPETAGGRTVKANLAPLCDVCHYGVHGLLWLLRLLGGSPTVSHVRRYPPGWWKFATLGYAACANAGTIDKIPNEGGVAG